MLLRTYDNIGVKNGGVTLAAWGTNFGLGALQDIMVLQMAKLYIVYVIAIISMIPQLKNVYQTLNNAALVLSQETDRTGHLHTHRVFFLLFQHYP